MPILFSPRQPQLRIVNSGGAVIEGPYRFDVGSGAQANLGMVLTSVDPSEIEETAAQFKNHLWSNIGSFLGYRFGITMNFSAVEGGGSNFYGLTLLHRLWRTSVETQFVYGALQFALFTGATFLAVVQVPGHGWAPTTSGTKQGLFDVTLQFESRDLIQVPGEWAQGQW